MLKRERAEDNAYVVHMDDLSDQLNNSNIGGNFGSGRLVNHISYADDMCLLSFSTAGLAAGMQKLLNICDQYNNNINNNNAFIFPT